MDRKTSDIWFGTACLAGFAFLSSTVGVFNRLIETDAWTMIFWRGLFGGTFALAVIAWRDGTSIWRTVRSIGWDGLVVVACSACATVCLLNALRFTTVADVWVIHATMPFMTAGLAWLVIGEREDAITLAASLAALAGVAIMVGPALGDVRLLGDLLAFAMTAFLSVMMVFLRKRRAVDMMPATGLSAFACGAIALPFAQAFTVDGWNLLLLALFGAQFGVALLLLALGSRRVSATRSALLGIADTPLGPLWVWLAFAEVPTTASLIGGTIVMASGACRHPAAADTAARQRAGLMSSTSIELISSGSPA